MRTRRAEGHVELESVRRVQRGAKSPPREQGDSGEDEERPDEPELLADHEKMKSVWAAGR
jgi:hypothetical protein